MIRIYKRCCVWGCMDVTSKRHRFPRRDPAILLKWIDILKDHPKVKGASKEEILTKLTVCDRHFTEESRCPELHRGLKGNAVPALFVSYSPPISDKKSHSKSRKKSRRRENNTFCVPNSFVQDKPTIVEPSVCETIDCPPIDDNRSFTGSREKHVNPFHQREKNAICVSESPVQDKSASEEPSFFEPIDLEEDQNSAQFPESKICFDVDTYLDFDIAEKTVIANSEHGENHGLWTDCKEENVDQCNEPNVLETISKELCRICGNNDSSLIPIFEESGMVDSHKVPLVRMLETYLPLQIERGDDLPLNVCFKCYDTLNQWHELYVTCMAADKTFKNTFHHDEIMVENNYENFCNRVQDNPNASTGGEHNYVKKEPVQESVYESVHESLPQPVPLENQENICCETCGFLVTGRKETTEEMSSELLDLMELMHIRKIRLYICKYCTEPFKNRYELKDHYVTCEDNPTICELCGTFVKHRKHFENHIIRTHDNKRIICDKCGESCKPHAFKQHQMSKHSQKDNHYCDLCCKVIQSNHLYSLHMQNHLKGKIKSIINIEPVSHYNSIVFICPICNQIFNDKPSLIVHLNEAGPIKCPKCRLKLKNERYLLLHTCKSWTCRYCDKSFYGKMKWKDHELLHTGERPYKCNFCDTFFRSLHQRTLHHRTHRLPLVECRYCSKKFKHSSALRKHMDFHEGIEFVCPICHKKLRRRTSMYAHIRKHGKDHYI